MCRPCGFENYVDMTETPLRSITNSGTWMPILAPTYSTKIFYRLNLYVKDSINPVFCSLCFFGMLLARDSIVGISIRSSISLPASLFTRSVIRHLVTNSFSYVSCKASYDVVLPRGPRDTFPKYRMTNPSLDPCQPNRHFRRNL